MIDSASLKARARQLGFDLCGVARAEAYSQLDLFQQWLARGFAGGMHYLARSAERRADVRNVLPSARVVIVLGTNYNTDRPYSTEIRDPGEALIARYAWGDDYHEVIGARMEALIAWMRTESAQTFEARAYVDTGPVQERVYAQYAGLGWVGKNTCLINPDIGSWLFLSEILCSLELVADDPGTDLCGECTMCLDACPTGALVEPRVLDATRCLSYLTIEHRGPIPEEYHAPLGSHVYGCDICQDVCPWNRVSPASDDPAWQPRPAFDRPRIDELAARSDDDLRRDLKDSAMKRTKVEGWRRNVGVASRRGTGTGQ